MGLRKVACRRTTHHNLRVKQTEWTAALADDSPNPRSAMPPDPQDPAVEPPHWLLRRTDQAGVSVLVLAALTATVGWWISHGGFEGRLIEVRDAPLETAHFQLDLNKADWPELAQLPGIGQILGQRIVQSRRDEGPYPSHDDLTRVRGIGPKTLEKLRPYLRPIPGEAEQNGKMSVR